MATFSNRDTIKAGIAAKMAANRDARAAATRDSSALRSLQRRGIGPISAGPGAMPPMGGGPSDGPNMPRPTDTGMPKATPMGGSQTSNLNTLAKLNPGLNTGAPATTTFQGGTTGGVSSGTPNIAAGTPANFFNTPTTPPPPGAAFKKGGKAKKMASGGMTSKSSTASRRGDGIAQRGKTKGRMV